MSDDNIVEWRPRDQVPRTIETFTSQPPVYKILETLPVRIDPNVSACRLIAGLASVGMVFKHDTRTGTVVIMPMTISVSETPRVFAAALPRIAGETLSPAAPASSARRVVARVVVMT